MGASFLGDVNALESFASRIGGYHPDQVITHSGDDNQYSPCVGFADLGNALLSAPCLKLEIDGVIENYLFGFSRRNSMLGNMVDVACIPVEHLWSSPNGRSRVHGRQFLS
jgi:hypothetical protein